MNKHNDRAVAWAVHLGANTPRRLAREWEIPNKQAQYLLGLSLKNDYLVRVGKRFAAKRLP